MSTKFSGDFDFAPDENVLEDYTQEHLKDYVLKIKAWKRKNPKKKVPQNFLVIDVALGQINWYRTFLSNLISTHRHRDMSILVATQSLSAGGHGSRTLSRNCFDMAILYHSSCINTQLSFYVAFGGWLPSLREFIQIYTHATKEKGTHYALVYQAGGEDLASTYFS